MKQKLLILLALSIATISHSQTFTVNYITYQVTSTTNNTVKTTDYDTAGGTVVNIPATATHNSTTYSVTEIGEETFYNKQLVSVSIPNSVLSIGNDAFGDNFLTSVNLPNSLMTIGNDAFSNNQLESITIPSSMTTIDSGVFAWNQLTSISLPNSITSIGNYAFTNNQLSNVTIPESVSSIGIRAFRSNSLTDVVSGSITPPTIVTGGSYDTFDDRSGINLTIPIGTTGAYVTDAGALWTGFNTVTEDASLSVSDVELSSNINIITTRAEIKVNYPNSIVLKEYTLYTLSGVKVITGNENTISKDFLPTGVYILKVSFDKGSLSKKFLVK